MIPVALRPHLKLPVMVAPMFLVSGPDLVVETCTAGLLGTFPSLNQRTSEGFEQWLIEIRRRLPRDAAPFGTMFGVHHSNPRQSADLALAIQYQVPLVITTLGINREVTDAIHAYGGLVFHDATTIRHAQKALAANVDGIIAVTQGAGGHAGTYNPFAFIAELRPLVAEKALILGGGISRGQSIAGAIAAGADLVSLGTRFIVATESMAPSGQKDMILSSTIDDIVFTDEISGIGASFLKQSIAKHRRDSSTPPRFSVANEITPKIWKDYWSAGQGIGSISAATNARQICRNLLEEFEDGAKRIRECCEMFTATHA